MKAYNCKLQFILVVTVIITMHMYVSSTDSCCCIQIVKMANLLVCTVAKISINCSLSYRLLWLHA